MVYRRNVKNGDDISLLAFGCMRLPNNFTDAERLVTDAVKSGVNYFDTAYIYPGNEALLGSILNKNNLRESIKIATKLPPYFIKKEKDFDKIFNTQLERLKTGYIDYYLIHMLTSKADWDRICAFGAIEWLENKKRKGKIKNIGFSYHGGADEYISIVDAYDWEFTMIQYNYLDEFNQAGIAGLKHAHAKGLPIMIMEPLRGGRLASRIPAKARELWENALPKRSPAEWAFRWLFNQTEILTVLSGMNNDYSLQENLRIASDGNYNLTDEEKNLYKTAQKLIIESTNVPCTGCAYCVPCPVGVDIPLCFSLYNDIPIEGKARAKLNYIMRTNKHNASLCVNCGKCEQHCPQNIEIRKKLGEVTKTFERGIYKPMKAMVRRFLKQE